MAKREKMALKKGEAKFQLIGKAKINDYTYKIDEQSQHSDWVYNQLNLGIDCGDYGDIYAEMMGGYGAERQNELYVHGKKESDKDPSKMVDDWSNTYKIDWEDRFDKNILEEIGESCFIRVGIEKDSKDNVFTKKFLSEYDAIEYIKEHLEDGVVLNVKGSLAYSEYNENIQTKKPIQSIYLSRVEDCKDFKATFVQTILVDKESLGKANKEKNVYPIYAKVVDYVGKPKIDGKKVEIKKNATFPKYFELEIKDEVKTEKLAKKLFTTKKSSDVYEIVVEGLISKGGATTNVTIDDLPEDIQELIELGAFSEEEALEKCVGKSSKIETYIITNPKINRVGEEKTPVIAINKDKYKVDDYVFYAALIEEATGGSDSNNESNETNEGDDDELDMDALLKDLD